MAELSRSDVTKSDYLGIDPLLDIAYQEISQLPSVKNHVVVYDERGRPDFISYKEYETVSLWWCILLYNRIYSTSDIVEGMVLQIPAYTSLMATVNRTIKYGSTGGNRTASNIVSI